MSTSVEVLCASFPSEFVVYLNYCKALRFEDRPDYSYLKRLFKDLFFRENYQYDFMFDWCALRQLGAGATPAALNNSQEQRQKQETEEESKRPQLQRQAQPALKNVLTPTRGLKSDFK